MHFYCINVKCKTIAEYEKSWRTYERQRAYERSIVSSVPVREIRPSTDIIPTTISDQPG